MYYQGKLFVHSSAAFTLTLIVALTHHRLPAPPGWLRTLPGPAVEGRTPPSALTRDVDPLSCTSWLGAATGTLSSASLSAQERTPSTR